MVMALKAGSGSCALLQLPSDGSLAPDRASPVVAANYATYPYLATKSRA